MIENGWLGKPFCLKPPEGALLGIAIAGAGAQGIELKPKRKKKMK